MEKWSIIIDRDILYKIQFCKEIKKWTYNNKKYKWEEYFYEKDNEKIYDINDSHYTTIK